MAKRLHRNSSRPCLARAVTQITCNRGSCGRVPANTLSLKVFFGRAYAFLHDELYGGLDNDIERAVWVVAPASRKRVLFLHRIRSLFEIK